MSPVAQAPVDSLRCPHRPPCPGCPRWGEPGIDPTGLRALADLAERHGAPAPEIVAGPELGQRHRARLAVRGRSGSPKIGLFQEGTHRIVDIPRCGTHHPLVNDVAAALKAALRETGIAPYADRPHVGMLRTLQVVVERASRSAQVVLVGNGTAPEGVLPLVEPLQASLAGRLHSLWWNGNPERTNRILGPHWAHLSGPETVREALGGCAVHFPPGAFGQSNLPLADRLAERVQAWIPPGARVAEFHAGCGGLGLGLLARGQSVVFNEVDPHGLTGLERSLEDLAPEARSRARIAPGAAGEHVSELAACDAAVVDPPRKGLEAPLLAALCETPPATLVYVSCDLPRFLVEAERLVTEGSLRLRAVEAWALFPFTRHVETVARFERQGPDPVPAKPV